MGHIPTLYIARTPDGIGLDLPSYSSRYHVGLNLQAAIPSALRIEPGERAYVPSGFEIGIPDGFCGQIVSEPQIARDLGLIVLDAPQVVHPADRGALFLLLQNTSAHEVVLHRGDFIAQLIIVPVIQVAWHDISEGIAQNGHVTQEKEVLLDEEASDEGHHNMISARRQYKSPRNRFAKENGNEDESAE